ncbi:MAG: HU family DNA-binding protein [Alphaproteobacteria bacterium]|nr:HU family DNA-binding protein [Alphaproteobacteria bacterium]
MNKSELVDAVAKAADLKKVDAEKAIDATFQAITQSLAQNNEVRLIGFGTFDVVETKASTGRNPRTGEAIQIPAKRKPKFRPGKQLTDSVAK